MMRSNKSIIETAASLCIRADLLRRRCKKRIFSKYGSIFYRL